MTVALLGSLFVAGLAGSLHCVGMCGPIVLAFTQATGTSSRFDFLAYHAGRIWTYAVLGLLAGWAGAELRAWQQPFGVATSVLVILSGVAALGFNPGLRLDFSFSGCGFKAVHSGGWLGVLVRDPRRVARLLLGAVMGLLPCGLVYSMLLVVATLPGPLWSAAGMVCFGAGTVPALSLVVLGGRAAPRWLRAQGTRAAAVLLIGMGLFMLARSLFVPAGHVHLMP